MKPLRVGIDFRAMQIGHQFRGIGEVVRQGCRQLDQRLDPSAELVLLVDPVGMAIDIPGVFGTMASPRSIRVLDYPEPANPRLAKLRAPVTPEREELLRANIDVLVQFDFMLGVPESVPCVVMMYDQIPLLLGDQYPKNYRPTYQGARRGGMPVAKAIYKAGTRRIYQRLLTAALQRSAGIVAISKHTAATTESYAQSQNLTGIAQKIRVAPLGFGTHSDGKRHELADLDVMERNRLSGLGLDTTPFVFFMGGSDERRRIDHLIAAFNDLRGRGRNLALVLGGYDFVTVERVLSSTTRKAIEESSYRHDIHLLGFVSAELRAWLYGHAEAFVFPSVHEGFGLPVLESLAMGCPVVAYDNTSIPEVAGPNSFLVANRWESLADGIATALDRDQSQKATDAEQGQAWAATFTWENLGRALTEMVEDAAA